MQRRDPQTPAPILQQTHTPGWRRQAAPPAPGFCARPPLLPRPRHCPCIVSTVRAKCTHLTYFAKNPFWRMNNYKQRRQEMCGPLTRNFLWNVSTGIYTVSLGFQEPDVGSQTSAKEAAPSPSHASAQGPGHVGERPGSQPRPIYKHLAAFTPVESEDHGSDHPAPWNSGSSQALPPPLAKIRQRRSGSSGPSPAAPTQGASHRTWWRETQHPAQPRAMGVGRGRAPLSSSRGWLPFTSMLRQAFSPLIPGAPPERAL